MEQRSIVVKRVRRRQNSSCDQCRKAKRACDAAIRAEHTDADGSSFPASTGRSTVRHANSRIPAAKCSNCQRNGRECTFEWLELALPKTIKANKKRTQHFGHVDVSRQSSFRVTSQPSTNSPTQGSTSDRSFSDLDKINFDIDPVNRGLFNIGETPELAFEEDLLTSIHQEDDFTRGAFATNQSSNWQPHVSGMGNVLSESRGSTNNLPFRPSVDSFQEQSRVETDPEEIAQMDTDQSSAYTGVWESEMGSSLPWTLSESVPTSKTSDDGLSSSLVSSNGPALAVNRWLLTQNWLRVYHDSMENALSCWLTERNCPYTLPRGTIRVDYPQTNSNFSGVLPGVWGPQWSNRIYKRVCSLDQFSSSLPGKGLTKTESLLAGKALNAAVMAFGVQWAQSGERGKIRDHSPFFASMSSVPGEMNLPAADEFGRSVQETLWNQARQALQEAAGIQSYRLAFANIIFSLTQRPLNIDDWRQSTNWTRRNQKRNTARGMEPEMSISSAEGKPNSLDNSLDAKWEALQEIINADGPPIFLEAASRQILSSRWKWEQYGRQLEKQATSPRLGKLSESERKPLEGAIPSQEHQETFKLLSWLAIMFDTISSTMLQRPLVVSDEDSSIETSDPWERTRRSSTYSSTDGVAAQTSMGIDLDGWDPGIGREGTPKESHSSDIWGRFFLETKDLQKLENLAANQWHCTLEEAAAILCDAAPVKVLLFRKVGQIQKLMSRRARSEALEAAIEDTLSVFTFWNRSYGKFISQCMARHHELPSRIQSWYIVLAGHWQLGVILFADVVEEMDAANLSELPQREMRRVSNFSWGMRINSAITISELCRCSLHGPALSFPTAREFTYPVNQVALLSEPWTVVLIQSFSRAGYVFVSQLNSPEKRSSNAWTSWEEEVNLAKVRCGYCIEGLVNLGNKSDMAYLAATFLKDCLRELDSG
ncbi:uncharacterized protein Z518_09820 [Rhinocladiella mackenziei CBS 650.93]|uniref:Zn(2)-C6 fungal-type domain-containing protein n=1 Tax=Rhinocladiella mackenziei CBS 650.93 TaxID=1442369 RepID=A0A0D2IVM7_9EURO|nr:uncharacterized protein Z518_09820 [Rhinocladiella mackenziei CBS 650.93]KIX00755.1 hypothetical protein Z518_09820 [Rhinocladiella mackenziei CBS 650.93]